MIYLNNAATTYPKPEAVKEAFAKRLDLPPSGQYRSAGLEDDADVFDICRKRIDRQDLFFLRLHRRA